MFKIEWYKDNLPVSTERAQIFFKSGVCTMEIFNAYIEDSGLYVCKATNSLGEDQTECSVTVQQRSGCLYKKYNSEMSSNFRVSSPDVNNNTSIIS